MLRKTMMYAAQQQSIYKTMMAIPATRKFAFRFVAGEAIDHAIAVVRVLNSLGITASLDHLGENVTTKEEALNAANEACEILAKIAVLKVEANVSIKLTQLGLDISPEFCLENTCRVLNAAREVQSFIRLDMEGSAYTERTLAIFRELHQERGYQNVGAVIQAYLYRSEKDIADLIAMKARVRLCKGAYSEPPDLAFPVKADTDANYLKIMKLLLKSGQYHGIATHDEQMINATKEFVRQEGIARDSFEFQMLYGIRRDLQRQLVAEGYKMRVYVPFGTQWYPYFTRRLAERPANLFFLLGNLTRT